MSTQIEKAKSIFLAAVEKYQPEQWPTYLDSACGDDARLRAQVQQLLKAHAEMGTFQEPPDSPKVTEDHDPLLEATATTIGPYKLLQQIGEGGFGVVYMAEQQEPVHRKVALKIIKPGMDTKEVIARFEAERQALALMDHPHIAKVLDAGATADGRPYFVMELVKGVPVTEFCDKNNSSTRQRLELFTSVCNAVQHAHQKGVIHRDLKPSNVMVTLHDGKPVVKVIDFGVSKAISQRLTEKTLFTRYGQMVGTPQYMSPEQAEMSGLDVDTRSDIYSLGVLLYELLTGTTPLEGKRLREAGYAEMVRLIREEEAPTPSHRLSTLKEQLLVVCQQRSTDERRLHQQINGDLDWIVMKALEKDRSRRYETASALAQDVTRHLNDEPVFASPPSTAYRLRKFVRRKRGLVLAVSAVAAALMVGVSASIVGFVQARQERNQAQLAQRAAENASTEAERQRAEAQRQGVEAQRERDEAKHQQERAESVLALMKQMLSSASLSAGRPRDYTVRQMLDDFSQSPDLEFDNNPEVGADIWLTMGEVYHSIEEIESAAQARRKGLRLARRAFKDEPIRIVPHLHWLAYDLVDTSRTELGCVHASEAEQLLREAVAIYERTRVSSDLLRSEVHARMVLAWSLMLQHRFAEAESVARQTIELEKQLSPGEEFIYLILAHCIRWGGGRDRLDEVLELVDTWLPYLRDAVTHGEQGDTARIRRLHVSYAFAIKFHVLWDQGRIEEADRCLTEAADWAEPGKEYATEAFVGHSLTRAWTMSALGSREEAKELISRTLEVCRRAGKTRMSMHVFRNSAGVLIVNDEVDQAERQLRQALEICAEDFGWRHLYTVLARICLALHYELAGQPQTASSHFQELIPDIETFVKQSGSNPEWVARLALAKSYNSVSSDHDLHDAIQLAESCFPHIARFYRTLPALALARAHERLGNNMQAVMALRDGWPERWSGQWTVPAYEPLLIERELLKLLMDFGDAADVEEAFRDSIVGRERYLTAGSTASLEAKARLASWLVDQQRAEDAAQMLSNCRQLADHPRASTRWKRLAVETAIKIEQALNRPQSVAEFQQKLAELDEATGDEARP